MRAARIDEWLPQYYELVQAEDILAVLAGRPSLTALWEETQRIAKLLDLIKGEDQNNEQRLAW